MEGKRLVWSRVLIASPTPAAENIGIWPNGIKKIQDKTKKRRTNHIRIKYKYINKLLGEEELSLESKWECVFFFQRGDGPVFIGLLRFS